MDILTAYAAHERIDCTASRFGMGAFASALLLLNDRWREPQEFPRAAAT
jgi:hypothetical protein